MTLAVAEKTLMTPDVLRLVLAPVETGACFCEFFPGQYPANIRPVSGQYVELWQPGSDHLSRSYSIANAPDGSGRIALNLRRVAGGRFTDWAFDEMQVGGHLCARARLGSFTMRSLPELPLLFVAGGTGFAPIHALVEQKARFQPTRDMVLAWGMRSADQFYALDDLAALAADAPGLRVVLATEEGTRDDLPDGSLLVTGMAVDAVQDVTLADGQETYAAGPPMLLRALSADLVGRGVDRAQLAVLPVSLFNHLLREDNEFAVSWGLDLAARLRDMYLREKRLKPRGSRDRVLNYLSSIQSGSDGVCLDISVKSWALELGVSHENLYRTLASLERERRLLRDGRRLRVVSKKPVATIITS